MSETRTRRLQAEIDATWQAIENAYEVEWRAYPAESRLTEPLAHGMRGPPRPPERRRPHDDGPDRA